MAHPSDLPTPSRLALLNICAALAVPFALQLVRIAVTSGDLLLLEPQVVFLCSAIGFVFLARALRLWSLAAGIVYFPLMALLLPRFATLLKELLRGYA